MATPPVGLPPKHLRAAYLAPQEGLLRETRATKLYYFPGPVALLVVLGILDVGAEAARHPGSVPGIPYLTPALVRLGQIGGTDLLTIVLDGVLGLTVLALVLLLVRWLRWITNVYAVTTSRVILQRGILSRDFEEIPVDQVRGIDVHQTATERLFGYGSVTVSSEQGRLLGNERWRGIPKPFQFQRLVEGATQLYRNGPSGGPTNPPAPAVAPAYFRPPGQL